MLSSLGEYANLNPRHESELPLQFDTEESASDTFDLTSLFAVESLDELRMNASIAEARSLL